MKTTNKHFEIFKKEVKKWMNEFKIGGWEVYFKINEEDKESLSGCSWNLKGKVCTFELNRNWPEGDKVDNNNIKKSALHEVLHLVIAKITTMAVRRYVNRDQVEEAEEEAVNTLINYILKK